jgi:hypothetical protein
MGVTVIHRLLEGNGGWSCFNDDTELRLLEDFDVQWREGRLALIDGEVLEGCFRFFPLVKGKPWWEWNTAVEEKELDKDRPYKVQVSLPDGEVMYLVWGLERAKSIDDDEKKLEEEEKEKEEVSDVVSPVRPVHELGRTVIPGKLGNTDVNISYYRGEYSVQFNSAEWSPLSNPIMSAPFSVLKDKEGRAYQVDTRTLIGVGERAENNWRGVLITVADFKRVELPDWVLTELSGRMLRVVGYATTRLQDWVKMEFEGVLDSSTPARGVSMTTLALPFGSVVGIGRCQSRSRANALTEFLRKVAECKNCEPEEYYACADHPVKRGEYPSGAFRAGTRTPHVSISDGERVDQDVEACLWELGDCSMLARSATALDPGGPGGQGEGQGGSFIAYETNGDLQFGFSGSFHHGALLDPKDPRIHEAISELVQDPKMVKS